MSSTRTQPGAAPHLERCFLFDAVEESYSVTGIAGSVPFWLQGNYYVNGPARFRRGDFHYRHWLDGDGMVASLQFSRDGVRFVSRFVRTRKLCDEEAAGAAIYRTFGTAFPGDRLRRNVMLEAPVNVSVYPYSGSLLAFGEQTLPLELDPVTLETIGEYDFNGRLNDLSPFAAHAKFDPSSGHMFNFGVSYSPAQPWLHMYEFDATGRLLSRRRQALQLSHSMHDFGLSSGHFIFYLSPLVMDFAKFLREGRSVMESLFWQPQLGSKILVQPRGTNGSGFALEIPPAYCLHFINCFEVNGRLAVDVIELDEPIYPQYQPLPDLFATAPSGRPVRYWIDLALRLLLDRIPLGYECTPDFPSLDSRLFSGPYRHFWMLGLSCAGQGGRKFFDQLVRCNWDDASPAEIYQVPVGEYFAGEPVFVGDSGKPEQGVIIVEHLKPRSGQVDFLLFDAFSLQAGPMARLPLKSPLHPGFHATFLKSADRGSIKH